MPKIGKPFNRDFEFTGSTDGDIGMQSRLLQNLLKKGFKLTTSIGGNSGLDFGGSSSEIPSNKLEVELTDEQKKTAGSVFGEKFSKLVVTMTPEQKSATISLNVEQREKIEEALGIEVENISIAREPIDFNMQ